jgi:hypothetical protein
MSASSSQFSDFEFLEQLGRGSFGVVHRVRRLADGLHYVLKRIDLSAMRASERELAVQECWLMASLDSPHVVRYYDSFIEDGALAIVMELCSGGDLQKALRARGALPEAEVWHVFLQVLLGVAFLHSRRTLHRDLKTANVFLVGGGGGGDGGDGSSLGTVKLGDLGVARVLGAETAFARTVVGTPYYLSPELCENRPYDGKSDMWALGVILYELCSGRHPFDARNQGALILKIISGAYPPLARDAYSDELVALSRALLERDAAQRPSAEEVLARPGVRARLRAASQAAPAAAPGWSAGVAVGADAGGAALAHGAGDGGDAAALAVMSRALTDSARLSSTTSAASTGVGAPALARETLGGHVHVSNARALGTLFLGAPAARAPAEGCQEVGDGPGDAAQNAWLRVIEDERARALRRGRDAEAFKEATVRAGAARSAGGSGGGGAGAAPRVVRVTPQPQRRPAPPPTKPSPPSAQQPSSTMTHAHSGSYAAAHSARRGGRRTRGGGVAGGVPGAGAGASNAPKNARRVPLPLSAEAEAAAAAAAGGARGGARVGAAWPQPARTPAAQRGSLSLAAAAVASPDAQLGGARARSQSNASAEEHAARARLRAVAEVAALPADLVAPPVGAGGGGAHDESLVGGGGGDVRGGGERPADAPVNDPYYAFEVCDEESTDGGEQRTERSAGGAIGAAGADAGEGTSVLIEHLSSDSLSGGDDSGSDDNGGGRAGESSDATSSMHGSGESDTDEDDAASAADFRPLVVVDKNGLGEAGDGVGAALASPTPTAAALVAERDALLAQAAALRARCEFEIPSELAPAVRALLLDGNDADDADGARALAPEAWLLLVRLEFINGKVAEVERLLSRAVGTA